MRKRIPTITADYTPTTEDWEAHDRVQAWQQRQQAKLAVGLAMRDGLRRNESITCTANEAPVLNTQLGSYPLTDEECDAILNPGGEA